MFAPRVFVSMVGALLVFAVVTYLLNGSVATTLVQTVICAVLIQVGYFLAVLCLVWREARRKQALKSVDPSSGKSANEAAKSDNVSVTRLNRPGHFNP